MGGLRRHCCPTYPLVVCRSSGRPRVSEGDPRASVVPASQGVDPPAVHQSVAWREGLARHRRTIRASADCRGPSRTSGPVGQTGQHALHRGRGEPLRRWKDGYFPLHQPRASTRCHSGLKSTPVGPWRRTVRSSTGDTLCPMQERLRTSPAPGSRRRRPWTRLGAVAAAAHVFYEAIAGVAMPYASRVGPLPAGILYLGSVVAVYREAGRQPRNHDTTFSMVNGVFLSMVIGHFASWPRRSVGGLPWLEECEGRSGRLMPAYTRSCTSPQSPALRGWSKTAGGAFACRRPSGAGPTSCSSHHESTHASALRPSNVAAGGIGDFNRPERSTRGQPRAPAYSSASRGRAAGRAP